MQRTTEKYFCMMMFKVYCLGKTNTALMRTDDHIEDMTNMTHHSSYGQMSLPQAQLSRAITTVQVTTT